MLPFNYLYIMIMFFNYLQKNIVPNACASFD